MKATGGAERARAPLPAMISIEIRGKKEGEEEKK
jgi:hypothetical protein